MDAWQSAAEARPGFTVGRLIARTFGTFFSNLGAFLPVLLVFHLPTLAMSLWAGPPPQLVTSGAELGGEVGAARYVALTWGAGILAWLISVISTGAITVGVVQALAGRPATAGELFRVGLGRFWAVLVVSLFVGLRVLLWSLLLVVPGVIATCRYFVAVAARMAEPELDAGGALERSRELTDGRKLSVFLALLLFWAVSVGLSLSVNVVGLRGDVIPFTALTLINWATGLVFGGLWAVASGVAYHDLRVEKEGADTGQLAAVFE